MMSDFSSRGGPKMQGMSCEGAYAIHSEKCAGCACVRLILGRAMCDRNFANFLEQNCQKMLLFVLKNILGHPFLF